MSHSLASALLTDPRCAKALGVKAARLEECGGATLLAEKKSSRRSGQCVQQRLPVCALSAFRRCCMLQRFLVHLAYMRIPRAVCLLVCSSYVAGLRVPAYRQLEPGRSDLCRTAFLATGSWNVSVPLPIPPSGSIQPVQSTTSHPQCYHAPRYSHLQSAIPGDRGQCMS